MPKACVPHEAGGGCFQTHPCIAARQQFDPDLVHRDAARCPREDPVEQEYAGKCTICENEVRGLVDVFLVLKIGDEL